MEHTIVLPYDAKVRNISITEMALKLSRPVVGSSQNKREGSVSNC